MFSDVVGTADRRPETVESTADLVARLIKDGPSSTWRKHAACQAVTAELFFPVGRTGDAVDQIAAAKSVCLTCPVRVACLRYALETNQEAGIWGGTSEEERAKIRKAWLTRRRRQRATGEAPNDAVRRERVIVRDRGAR